MGFRLARLAALGAAGLVVTGGVTASAQAESTDQWYPVPSSGSYTVHGHGYGHGHGMSQYGAQGAALQGLSHRRILSFYYPGTTLGHARHRIRVLITADTTSDLVVKARSGLTVKDRGSGSAYQLPTDLGATRWRLSVGTGNSNVVSWFHRSWHRWRPGGRAALVGEGQFGAGGAPVTLVLPSGTARYRGALRAAQPSSGSTDRDTVNVLGLNAYVRGVVPAEMPASWEPEAVQAQAVAARTYAVWSRHANTGRHYHICDTTACQVYAGVAAEHPLGDAAVTATSREVLRYAGEPAFTQFSASSGGWTSAGGPAYLSARRDPYDGWSGNGYHSWSVKLSPTAIRQAYPSIGRLRGIRVVQRDGHGQWRGRVESMVLDGRRDGVTLSGDTFRSVFGLRSVWFSFTR